MTPRHVLVADDHAVTRRGISDLLADTWPDVEVVEVGSGEAVLARIDERPWSLLLLDVRMPGPGIVELIGAVRARLTEVPVLILTAMTEIGYVVETMRAGANGVIHKHRAVDELIEAIGRVSAGGVYLHPEDAAAIAAGLQPGASEPPHLRLSARELEVLRLMALGRPVKAVAGELEISEKTVATYVVRIREKTGLRNAVEFSRYAIRHRLID